MKCLIKVNTAPPARVAPTIIKLIMLCDLFHGFPLEAAVSLAFVSTERISSCHDCMDYHRVTQKAFFITAFHTNLDTFENRYLDFISVDVNKRFTEILAVGKVLLYLFF